MRADVARTPLAAIGDVHGDAERLRALLARTELAGRALVFLGDLVNRGPNARQVVELVVELQGRATLLQSNHDRAFLQYVYHGDFLAFASIGGLHTIKSYVLHARGDVHAQLRQAVPSSHRRLLEDAVPFIESDQWLLSHAGINPSRPQSRRPEDLWYGDQKGLFSAAWSIGKRVVCGHYAQPSLRPFCSSNLICIDTGCGTLPGGPLTALLLPEFECFSV